jgi:hypothetical protein
LPHALPEIPFGRLDEQVKVVCHLAKRVDYEMKPLANALSFDKPRETIPPVAKDELTSVASASNVIEGAGKF